MFGLNETIDELAVSNSVHWYCHVLRREEVRVLRKALDCEVDGQMKIGRPKRTWKKLVDEAIVRMGNALCRSM